MINAASMAPATHDAYDVFRAEAEPALAVDDVHAREVFAIRLERHFADFHEPLRRLYGAEEGGAGWRRRLARLLAQAAGERSAELRRLDYEREISPDWLQRETMVGYVCYVDRFAGTLSGVAERLAYLRELGVTYLHLMPLLRARPAPNDGGYAVQDYDAVAPELGTMDDLEALAGRLRGEGMSLCVDLVLNHTAAEHAWARAARAGDPRALARYHTFPDRTEPDRWDATLRPVFPEVKPGSFTWVPDMDGAGRWVWSTFYPFQWDLDWSEPDVLCDMLATLLRLANRGVDVFRLDAVPFLWKRKGTDCQNQPEVHDLLQALRALVRVVAPAVAFKAEAVVPTHELVRYLGQGRHAGKECDLAYHNSLMVLLWSSLATRRADLMTRTLQATPHPPANTTWITYVRCHDDIGWAVTEDEAAAVGLDGATHRRFLSDFYAGEHPGSFARGARFQVDPRTGDARTSGSAASLAGLRTDGGPPGGEEDELALARVLALYSVAFSFGGLPLVYMGDELGLLNDASYLADPARAADNRWMHRPAMDWERAARRHDPATIEGRLFGGLRELAAARRRTRALHGAGRSDAVDTGNPHVLAYVREHLGHRLLALVNVTEERQAVHASLPGAHGLGPDALDVVRGRAGALSAQGDALWFGPYGYAWLAPL